MKLKINLFLFVVILFAPYNLLVGQVSGSNDSDDKQPVPSADLQVQYRDEIRKSAEFAVDETSFESARASAEKLVKAGRKVDDNSAKQYSLYREGLRLALNNCDPDSAMFAIDQLDQDFQVDVWKLVLEASDTLRQTAKARKQSEPVRKMVDEYANQAISAEKFEVAKTLIGRSIVLSSAMGDGPGKEQRAEFKKEVSTLQSFKSGAEKAKETLAVSPDDSNAQLAMGHYLVFVKGDFGAGLKYWAKCQSVKYKKMAEMESGASKNQPAQMFDLAGKWFDLANKTSGIREKRFKERSRYWYELCSVELQGELKTQAKNRLAELEAFFKNPQSNVGAISVAGSNLAPPPTFAPATQKSIDAGLNWLASFQLPDGGWSFKHKVGPGAFRQANSNESDIASRFAATGMAILVFNKAGHTHKSGKYKKSVQGGLNYLASVGKSSGRGVSFYENGGTMYSHAIVARAFCELYISTGDTKLKKYAQGSIWNIEDCQDPIGGGWRYRPRERGDTSVFGWQMAALDAAGRAKLNTNIRTAKLASKFLDSVVTADGLTFGYTDPPKGKISVNARTVIGMLGRYQLGLEPSHANFVTVAERVAAKGVDANYKDPYYYFYAAKLMRIHGGEDWTKWKSKVDSMLISKQSSKDFETGSWFAGKADHTAEKAGRLGVTMFALLTLMEQ